MGCVNRAAPSAAGLGANLSALRGHNAALVLGLLRGAREHGVSRLELAERTGLTPQAVSKITARLRAEGLVTESGHTASTGGKPPTVLRLVSGARQAVGLHLDRDELTAVLVDLTGESLALRTSPLDFGAGSEGVLDAAAEAVAALVEGRVPGGPRLVGVGVAAPGPLDHRLGVLHRVTGFPQWDGFPLRDALAERLGLPVALDKDTNAAALGLALDRVGGPGGSGWTAPGQASSRSPTSTWEPGWAPGLVLGGDVHRGARTGAGEFGHQVVQLDGPPCDCGRRGCVEALCLAAVADGDSARAARLLGVGAAHLVRLLDIDRMPLGGRVVLADAAAYARGVAGELADAAPGSVRPVPVEIVAHGARTVADGAAQLVLAGLFAPS